MQYQQKTGKSILESLEGSGLTPTSHCRDGFCGACRIKVSPEDLKNIGALGDALGFHDHNSEILACVSTLQEGKIDLLLNPPEPGKGIRLLHESEASILHDIDLEQLAKEIEMSIFPERRQEVSASPIRYKEWSLAPFDSGEDGNKATHLFNRLNILHN